MKKIKIFTAVLIASAILVCLCSCGNNKRIAFENAMNALKNADLLLLRTCVTEESALAVETAENSYALLDENSSSTFRKLMSFLKYSYSASDTENPDNTVLHVTVTYVKLDILSADVAASISVSGTAAVDEIGKLIENGTVEKSYLTTESVDVTMKNVGGKYVIAFESNENGALWTVLGMTNFLRWLSAQK